MVILDLQKYNQFPNPLLFLSSGAPADRMFDFNDFLDFRGAEMGFWTFKNISVS